MPLEGGSFIQVDSRVYWHAAVVIYTDMFSPFAWRAPKLQASCDIDV